MKDKKSPPFILGKAAPRAAREEAREGMGKKAAFASAKKQVGAKTKAAPKKKGY